ncbi:sialate O-acetylesterase [Draconibacterium sp. IB214405]|uniref:sialate O-acetylesterase n=1 Tax=Draconibacterium sp. IB214405 TaxID=3097352 RepID=UPI002A111651|nr:sialate O-acetylesterase [Draconibacterium sp. IB214405]MDX8339603.1 sialate O-acetylesterase [Draconibacterium sp. IB214405]
MRIIRIQYCLLSLVLIFALCREVNAAIKLPQLVSNGMVLQRNEPVRIWGWADAGEKVQVDFLGTAYKTTADNNGNWQLELAAMDAGGPYSITINDIELTDILVGDVWLASGQSNMELQLRRVMDLYADEILKINTDQIRLFRSSTRENAENEKGDYPDGKWLSSTPENIMEFSAVAWFFADKIRQSHNVPVGIISTAIGGSPAEAWLSKNTVTPFLNKWIEECAQVDSMRDADIEKNGEIEPYNWYAEVNKNDPGTGKWSKNDVDVSGWPQISLPGYWTDKGVDFWNGSIWFYKEFELDESLAGAEAILRLGRIIDSDSAFVNGTFVGNITYQYPPRIYTIPEGLLKAGTNKVMVRVFNPGGRGGFVEEKPYEVRVGNEVIDMTGDWQYHIGAELNPPKTNFNYPGFRPGGLYNSLINPMKNYTVKGVIWYQGETNAGRGFEYRQLFKDLIVDWRDELDNAEMPFLFVQLANLGLPNKQPVENGWAETRDAQRQALELPNTGMAVAFDIGEWNDIHPLNKKEVARRLYLEAERVAYGNKDIVSAGPLYQSMKIDGGSILLTFSSVGSGMYANSLLEGFQIAGDDGKFVWAKAVVMNKNTVKVWSPDIKKPVAVRYAWDGNPAGSNLKNIEGLPASPFTTED